MVSYKAWSTFSEESLAAEDIVDSTVHAQAMFSWTLFGHIDPGRPPAVYVTDCCSLVQHLRNLTPKCVEKRIAIDQMTFREIISPGIINAVLWRDTRAQLADSLTKLMTTERLYGESASGGIDLTNPAKLSTGKKADAGKGLGIKLEIFCLLVPNGEEYFYCDPFGDRFAFRC